MLHSIIDSIDSIHAANEATTSSHSRPRRSITRESDIPSLAAATPAMRDEEPRRVSKQPRCLHDVITKDVSSALIGMEMKIMIMKRAPKHPQRPTFFNRRRCHAPPLFVLMSTYCMYVPMSVF